MEEDEKAYLHSVVQWSESLSKLILQDEGLSLLESDSDAAMYLHTISEDSKQRLANCRATRTINSQLEVMASNLKSLTAVLPDNDGIDPWIDDDDDNDNAKDALVGWGEQISENGFIVLEDRHSIRSIACSGQRALYVTDAGDVFSVGDNGTGQPTSQLLSPDIMTPQIIGELVLERVLLGRRVVSVACGHLHSVALTQGGRLWSWGCGEHGRLGHGDEVDQPAPRLCEALLHSHVRAIACGGAHTVAIVSPSRVFSWGLGRSGRLGLNDFRERNYSTPQLVDVDNQLQMMSDAVHALLGCDLDPRTAAMRDEPVVGVACGWAFTLLLGANGTVRAFGAGQDGQCGVLPAVNQYAPIEVRSLSDLNIVQISCGYHHAIAVNAHGVLYSWGTGGEGQLGHGASTTVAYEPTRIKVNSKLKPVSANAGQFHNVCVADDGALWGWGSNTHGAVDDECAVEPASTPSNIVWRPKLIDSLQTRSSENPKLENTQVKHAAAGGHFTVCVLGKRSTHENNAKHPQDSPSNSSSSSPISLPNPEWMVSEGCFSHGKEQRAAVALRIQSQSGSFCGGRIGFWKKSKFVPRIGVLSSTGILEMYLQLNASTPEEVIDIHGHDVEIRCKTNTLEAWRAKPGYEYTLLVRLQMNSNVEARVWGDALSHHATADRLQAPRLGIHQASTPAITGRRDAWSSAIGNQLRITPELYLIYKERATHQEGIGMDIRRTLPTLLLFGRRGEPLYEQLREVLEVYQCYRPDVGYVQGMSYVAAMICLHVPNNPYQAFVCLANLLTAYHLFDFYRLGQAYDRVQSYYKIIDMVIEKSSRGLWKQLNNLKVLQEVHVTCFQWLQTLFVRRLPLEIVTLLWDAFLCRRDSTVMIRACVAILLCRKHGIMTATTQEDVLLQLRGQPRIDEFMKITFTEVQVPHLARQKLNNMFEVYP